MNAVVNVKPESQALLKELSRRTGRSMRSIAAEAFEAYEVTLQRQDTVLPLLVAALEKTCIAAVTRACAQGVHQAILEALEDQRKRDAYKPWLKRTDADDLEDAPEGYENLPVEAVEAEDGGRDEQTN